MNTEELAKHGFTLQGELGETAYAVTYQALQHSLGRTVQLRLLKPEFEERPDVVSYFLDIGRILAHVKSEKVVSVFDIISEPGCYCIVTETTANQTLQEELDAGTTFSRKQALTLVYQTAEGVAFLWSHFNLVLHNLSAASICRDPSSGVKITSFEQAERSEEEGGAMPCDDLIGIGSLLRNLCTESDGTLPDDIAEVAARLDSTDPETRYLSWNAVLEALRALLAATETTTRYRIRRTAKATAEQPQPPTGVFAEHERDLRGERIRLETGLWVLLLCWFVLLYWIRSSPTKTARVPPPARETEEHVPNAVAETPQPETPATPPAPKLKPETPVSEPVNAPEPAISPATAAAAQKKLLALFLSKGITAAQRAAETDTALPSRMKAVFAHVPTQQELLRTKLEKKIGKMLPLNYGGKQREVKLVAINETSLSLETKNRAVELPFENLPIEEKIEWIGKTEKPEETLAVCELLLSIGRKADAVQLLSQDARLSPFLPLDD